MDDDPKHVLELAKLANNQQNPHLALQHLRSIERVVEDSPETAIWADHRLVLAESYSALGDKVATSLFEEALELLRKLPENQPGLELRAREHFADHLCRDRRFSKARELYVAAKLIATGIGKEDVARIQMKIVAIDLRVDNDPEFENFQTLKRVALQRHAMYQLQLAAWMQHLGRQDRAGRGLRAARSMNRASEEYFADLIDSVRDLPE
jgi:tetratricopeptide (TPR) repeat protein